jgi:hypothetical protein
MLSQRPRVSRCTRRAVEARHRVPPSRFYLASAAGYAECPARSRSTPWDLGVSTSASVSVLRRRAGYQLSALGWVAGAGSARTVTPTETRVDSDYAGGAMRTVSTGRASASTGSNNSG